MIEAVNSTIAAATVSRALPEQAISGRDVAVSPVQAQKAAPTAPYVSPYISVNVDYNKAVLQLRNGETGEVENQFPSENQLRAYQRAQAQARRAGEQARTPTQSEVREISPVNNAIVTQKVEAPAEVELSQPQAQPVQNEPAQTQVSSATIEKSTFTTQA